MPVELTNSIGIKLIFIPAGEFKMGSPDNDSDAHSDEKPQHTVRITKPFYLGVSEVTQEQYERVMERNPSHFKGAELPVEMVSLEDAAAFCRKLSELLAEQSTGRVYRLPTEAEWEYACRAGSKTKWSFGDAESSLGDYAWYESNSGSKTHPVGRKKPNAWGLYDVYGNVAEWCSGWFGTYALTMLSDPTGPATGSSRVIRGGGWGNKARNCRSAIRYRSKLGNRNGILGFRLAFSTVDQSDVRAESPRPSRTETPRKPSVSTPSKAPQQPIPAAATGTDSVPSLAVAPFDAPAARAHQQAWSRYLGQSVEVTNSLGMKLVLIPAGEFLMGSPRQEFDNLLQEYPTTSRKYFEQEQPQHRVRLTKPCYLGMYEVTQAEYERVMGTNPSSFSRSGDCSQQVSGQDTSRFPVERVSWEDAVEFCRKLSAMPDEQSAGRVYRLPTEAEWEYACRAGTTTTWYSGAQTIDLQAASPSSLNELTSLKSDVVKISTF